MNRFRKKQLGFLAFESILVAIEIIIASSLSLLVLSLGVYSVINPTLNIANKLVKIGVLLGTTPIITSLYISTIKMFKGLKEDLKTFKNDPKDDNKEKKKEIKKKNKKEIKKEKTKDIIKKNKTLENNYNFRENKKGKVKVKVKKRYKNYKI